MEEASYFQSFAQVSVLTEEDKKQIRSDCLLLEEKQNLVEDLSCLPKMQLDDINRNLIPTEVNRHLEDGTFSLFHDF